MVRALLIVLALAFGLATATAQGKGDAAVPLYQWIATESVPKGFPVHAVSGDLIFPDGSSIYVPGGRNASNGWGKRGSTHVVGDPMRPVPVRLHLTWFSYAEDRFYSGDFALPADRMATLFAAGVIAPGTGQKIGYDAIIVGMAPGGAAAVWMAAGPLVLEVAAFRAAPADLPWSRVLDNPAIARSDYVTDVLTRAVGPDAAAALRANGPQPGLFERRHTRRAWVPDVSGDGTASSLWIRYVNGENEPFLVEGAAPPRVMRAAPQEIRLDWTDPGGTLIGAIIEIDEAEMVTAFAALARQEDRQPMTLDLRIEPGGRALRAVLRTAHGAWRLRDAKIKLFRRKS
ncbi:MAG: hypothetical protein ACJAVR_001847 [Paracoccaceae bacterium]|jgi:hypothetical protein